MTDIHPIRLARLQSGQPLGVVAEATNIDKSLLSKYERGLLVPTAPKARALADYYGITVAELLGAIPPSARRDAA